MLDSAVLSLCFFVAGMFTVLNGPLWLSVRVRVFAGGRQAPGWLHRGVSWFSRLAGLVMLATWAWVSTGALKPTLLLVLVVAIGLFLVLDGPIRLITQYRIFHRGRDAPAWMNCVAVWFTRIGGAVLLIAALITGTWAAIS